MSQTSIIEGAQIISRVTFRDLTGAIADPPGVTFAVRADAAPSPAIYVYNTHPEVTRTGVGIYVAAVSAPTAGKWHYEWWALDANDDPTVKLGRTITVVESKVVGS